MSYLMWIGTKVVNFATRKRNIGLGVATVGVGIIAIVGAGSLNFEVRQFFGVIEAFKFSNEGGLNDHLTTLSAYGALVIIALGIFMAISDWRHERQERQRKRVAVVEVRGLVDTSDHPLLEAVPESLVGQRHSLLLDARQKLSSNPPQVAQVLNEIYLMPRDLRRIRDDNARADVQVVAGGIMQVPLLFFAGVVLEDEGNVLVMEWDRIHSRWGELADADSGDRFTITGLDTVPPGSEVVLAVSASYVASLPDIEKAFPGTPLVHLRHPKPVPNRLWYTGENAALQQQFLETLGQLEGLKVSMVHLILAAPASICINFGRRYDPHNMPPLRCYQWQRAEENPYPWAVEMPTAPEQPGKYVQHSLPELNATK
ncbi:SAVED domain-containing protein [Pseudomonas sp. NPDC089752]|uniref:SAVED domain-containing protein n=1 Tax=Pseudomonas sp. NPDC089752 TaxID=3364472 RepID=UPI0038160F09